MRATKATIRARYCAEVERLAVAQLPALAGRIDWNLVTYHFLSGVSAQEAARAQASLSLR